MGEEDKLLLAAQKWSLQSSSSSSDALLEQSSNSNISQDVSLHHHTMSRGIQSLSTDTVTPTILANSADDSNINTSISQTISSVPSYINNPSLWAPLSISSNSNDFISDPSVLAAAMSGTRDIEHVVQYEAPSKHLPSSRDRDIVPEKCKRSN